jgi:hypothetical protein
MPFYRLNKEYIQQGIYMSETQESTDEIGLYGGIVTRTKPKILSLVSLSGEAEPIGFALLMSPYKAQLVDVESIVAGIDTALAEENGGKLTQQEVEAIRKNVTTNMAAADLQFKANLYTTKQVNDRGNVPRLVFPLPIDIRDQLMVNYQTSDMGIAGAAASFGADLAKNIKQGRGLDMGNDTTSSALQAVGLNFLKEIAPSTTPLVGQYLGAVANPFTVTSFRNVEPRVYNFEFRITPANQAQSETLQECINTLRYCALPDPTAAGLTLAIPYRFKLAWLGALKMFDFSEAVLTRIEVNYSSGGNPAFFEYTQSKLTNGSEGYHPVAVTIALEFRELFPLTKETIVPRSGKSEYDGEMIPRILGRREFNDIASSEETQAGATTDPAENQTGARDDALNTPVNADREAVQQAQSVYNDSVKKMESSSRELKNEGEGGYDAQRAIKREITAADVYLAVNRHDTAVDSYNGALNVLKSNSLSSKYVQDIPPAKTWLEKVDDGTSGSRTSSFVWYAVYNTGNVDWNKTSGGGG